MPSADEIQQTDPEENLQPCPECCTMCLPHQIHTCSSCGQQYCDACYASHDCHKPNPPPPSRCDNCGKMTRGDKLQNIGGRNLCPDCVPHTSNESPKNFTGIMIALIIVIAVIAAFFVLPPLFSSNSVTTTEITPSTPAPTVVTTVPIRTVTATTQPTTYATPEFNTMGTIRIKYPSLSRYNPPVLSELPEDTEDIVQKYSTGRDNYLAYFAAYQLNLAELQFDTVGNIYEGSWTQFSQINDKLETYRSEVNRIGSNLNIWIGQYNLLPGAEQISWKHQDLPALHPYN